MRTIILAAAAVALLAGCGSTGGYGSGPPPSVSSGSSTNSASPSIPGVPSPAYTWPSHATCGVERWAVKTGTDPGAGQIRSRVVNTSVYTLVHKPVPVDISDGRIAPVEDTIYRVHATMTGFKQEADSDYHLILVASGLSMIAEIPDPPCAKGSPLLGGIETARSEFDARYTASDSFTQVSQEVIVTGVGFFDTDHGQTGVAPNAIELHPVLSITFQGAGATRAAAQPSPTRHHHHSAPPPPPPAAACHPTTPSGNCYEPGEFCSSAEHGETGVAGDGKTITCSPPSSGSTWRWED